MAFMILINWISLHQIESLRYPPAILQQHTNLHYYTLNQLPLSLFDLQQHISNKANKKTKTNTETTKLFRLTHFISFNPLNFMRTRSPCKSGLNSDSILKW